MNASKSIGWLIEAVLLLAGSCFGPRMSAQNRNSQPDSADVWTVLTFDPKGDARDPSLADAAQLSYQYDKEHDYLWFRVSLYSAPNEQTFGVSIMFDTGGDEAAKMNWWGANNTFRFDKLLTAWVTRGANGFQGTIGVSDAQGARAKQFNNLSKSNLQLKVEDDSILIGVKRADLTDKLKMNLIAAVGSDKQWNDDLPNARSAVLDLATEKSKIGLREIDRHRNNLELPAGSATLADNQPPLILKKGQGKQELVLVPGMYSGSKSFAGFIARNDSQYKFYLLTPPGINGTTPRSMPAAGTSFSEMTWTRRLTADIRDLIHREKLSKPVIIAERQPGAQAAMDLAIEHPDEVGGVVLIGTNLLQGFFSPKDPTRKVPIAFADRGPLVDEVWVAKWFKYVTPETWLSGDLRPQLLSTDPTMAQAAWDGLETTPVQVKIRYLCEFWASDVTRGFDRLQVPVLALIPGFDEKFLADPANAFAKPAFLDSWNTLVPKHTKLELVKIPDARMLVLDDQSKLADDAIAKFVSSLK
jgi:pimeloyl-ACP methyl ester carboxylesterase